MLKWHHLTCFAHKLNLCLNRYGIDLVPDVFRLVNKCKEIVKCFRHKGSVVSETQSQFRDFMDNLVENDHTYHQIVSIPNTSLKQPVPTRWNSIHTMLESIVLNEAIINTLLYKYGKNHLNLLKSELDAIIRLVNFLEPFKKISEQIQGEKYPTLSFIWPYLCRMKMLCKPKEPLEIVMGKEVEEDDYNVVVLKPSDGGYVTDDYGLSELKKSVYQALQRKFPIKEIYLLSSNLDPRFKTLKDRFLTVDQYKTSIKSFLLEIGLPDYEFFTDSLLPEAQSIPPKNKFESMFGDLMENNLQTTNNPITTEIESYMALPPLSSKELDSFDLISWWKEQRINFPILSKIFRKIHGIVATSAPSERVFSISGNCVTEKRSRILPSMVDQLVFLNANIPRQSK